MFYSIKEGLNGLYRTKISSMITISIISLTLIVISIFTIFTINVKAVIDSIQNRIELEIFIDNSFDAAKKENLRFQILKYDGVQSIKYISKEDAALIFKKQFDQDIFDILEENPLPSSFQIFLTKNFRNSIKVKKLVDELSKLEGVDDVALRQDILIQIEKYIKMIYYIFFGTGALLVFGSIFLISNTIKLTIFSKQPIIETMKLVGATKKFIRRPYLVEGLVQGFFGSIFASLILFIFLNFINIEIPNLIVVPKEIFLIIFLIGVFLGFLGSILAIQRFLKY